MPYVSYLFEHLSYLFETQNMIKSQFFGGKIILNSPPYTPVHTPIMLVPGLAKINYPRDFLRDGRLALQINLP